MKFNDEPNVMVITTKRIIDKVAKVTLVFHDEDDGMWQFLDGIDNDENGAAIISLQEMVNIDNSVEEVADLPLGWVAWRDDSQPLWNRQVNN
jgi:hypothetical protein